jgi:DNA end-binding protein Ku
LIENLAAEWNPEKYTDEYRENLMKIIKAKQKGRGVRLEPAVEPRGAEVVDLMERLRQSLESTKKKRGGASRKRKTSRHAA